MRKVFLLLAAVLFLAPGLAQARQINPADVKLTDGYKIELAVSDLAAPTMVAFDDQDRMLIAESGYGGGGEAKITRIEKNGQKTFLLSPDKLGSELPITAVTFFDGKVYVVHGGSVSVIENGGNLKTIVNGIPFGDHQANQLVFNEGWGYLGVGTVTNSGVVGPDNAIFGWLKDPAQRQTHDVPCSDFELTGQTFESENVIGNPDEKVQTGAYSAFGTASNSVKGAAKCNGAILRFRPDGSNLEVFASGLRNPYGLEFDTQGQLFITMHGFDARGSRPIENAWDCFYKIQPGGWYGWPDFACDIPVTDEQFKVTDKPAAQFLIKNHPTGTPPAPIAKFNPHAATNGFAFAPNDGWGKPTDAFIALFGDFTPATGTVDEPQGVKVIRLDTFSGQTSDFIGNKVAGQASRQNAGGLEHPSDVTFGPDGNMYIADWGVAAVSTEGLKLEQNSGVIWKVSKGSQDNQAALITAPSWQLKVLLLLILLASTWHLGRGTRFIPPASYSLQQGIFAGAVTALAAIFISVWALKLPWHTPPRVFGTMIIGKAALENVLEFKLTPTVIGALTLLALAIILAFVFSRVVRSVAKWRYLLSSILFGLTVWALTQYFVFYALFPLITEKGFPPKWYALTFTVLGLALAIFRWIYPFKNEVQKRSTR